MSSSATKQDGDIAPSTSNSAIVTPTRVIVHPLVLLSVVDHYNRVAKDTKNRVVGVLLGTVDRATGIYEVTNSFGVPFEEDAKDPNIWFLDHNFVENMFGMHRRVAVKEVIIGWYSTGPKVKPSDIVIHNQIFSKYIQQPIFVIVDVKLEKQAQALGAAAAGAVEDDGDIRMAGPVGSAIDQAANVVFGGSIPTEAYFSREELQDENSQPKPTFAHVQSEIGAQEAEEIGVEHLLRDVKDATLTDLHSSVGARLNSLKEFRDKLSNILSYLKDVESGRLPSNHQIMYLLQDVFNLLPGMQREDTRLSSAEQLNDEMLGMYMAGITRAIVSLHDLINNKISLREEEKKKISGTTTEKEGAKTNGAAAKDGKKEEAAAKESKK